MFHGEKEDIVQVQDVQRGYHYLKRLEWRLEIQAVPILDLIIGVE